ncbi:MOSC domain-containing protein [Calidithermus timidus]|jgi:MOSC domain-containing protein YiiM|uniref:MOSC domain-containing protein n=1 Tax=Calidithermus timidus TaxID=307124 RepID=UPI0003772EE1|nr:MOSC domain-containing protein [Calidithermus timidus]
MRLIAVNLGKEREVQVGERTVRTGIYKTPVTGKVRIGAYGLEADVVADTKHHGGRDQAVYAYSAEDYDWWAEQLGEALEPGTFGENLTLSSFGPEPVRIGDRFRVGEVLLEVSAPRIPCGVFATRMNDHPAIAAKIRLEWVRQFRQARRPGFYARVLVSGQVQAGDPIERLSTPHDYPTLAELFELHYAKKPDPARVRWLLEAPVAERTRRAWERWLEASFRRDSGVEHSARSA